jgi:hypothetical protein
MKKIILRILVGAIIAVGGSTIGYAQLTRSYQAHVPFDFKVENTSMKAGDYRIRPILTASGIGYLELLDLDHNKSRILAIVGASDYGWDDNATNKFTFVDDNGRYALTSIETATFRKNIPGVTASARIMTKNTKAPSLVTVALK